MIPVLNPSRSDGDDASKKAVSLRDITESYCDLTSILELRRSVQKNVHSGLYYQSTGRKALSSLDRPDRDRKEAHIRRNRGPPSVFVADSTFHEIVSCEPRSFGVRRFYCARFHSRLTLLYAARSCFISSRFSNSVNSVS